MKKLVIREYQRKKGYMKKVLFASAAALFMLSGCAAGTGITEREDAAERTDAAGRTDTLGKGEEPYVLDWYINYSWFTSKWGAI